RDCELLSDYLVNDCEMKIRAKAPREGHVGFMRECWPRCRRNISCRSYRSCGDNRVVRDQPTTGKKRRSALGRGALRRGSMSNQKNYDSKPRQRFPLASKFVHRNSSSSEWDVHS